MANGWKLWINCAKCHGDGVVLNYAGKDGVDPLDITLPEGVTPDSMTCPGCNGAKRYPWGWLEEELTEMI